MPLTPKRGRSITLLVAVLLFLCTGSLATAGSQPNQDREVYIGVHLVDVAKIDLRDGSFEARFYLWARWAGDSGAVPQVEIVNAEQRTFEEVARERDGAWNSVRWRVQGTIRTRFVVSEFPFDRHEIEVRVRLGADQGRLNADLAASSAEPSFTASGWVYEPYFAARSRAVTVASDLGAIATEGLPRRATELSFLITLERPWLALALRYLPLLIIVAVATVALLTPPAALEISTTIIVTALLAAIAFYLTEAGTMPDVPYMTRAQTVFLLAYALILAALIVAYAVYYLRQTEIVARVLAGVAFLGIAGAATIGTVWFLRPVDTVQALPSASPVVTASRPETSRTDATVMLPNLGDSLPFNIHARVLRRGGWGFDLDGTLAPHLLAAFPAMTNDLVRFLPDGRMRVIWRLKPSLVWGDGTPIVAEDLVVGQRQAHGSAVRLTVRDPLTLEAVYEAREQRFLRPFAILPHRTFQPIFEAGGWSGVLQRLRTAPPPLDGPYILERFMPGQEAIVVRNPNFAGRRPVLDRIRFVHAGSADRYVAALTTGEADVGTGTTEATLARFDGQPSVIAERFDAASFYRLDIDTSRPPFDDVRVRRALAHAIDRSALGRNGSVAASFRLPSAADYAADVAPLKFDPARTRALIAEAGLDTATPIRFWVLATRMQSAERALIETVLKNLVDAGFPVVLTPYARPADLPKPRDGLQWALSTVGDGTEAFLWNTAPDDGRTGRFDAIAKRHGREVASLWQTWETTPYEPRRIEASRRLQQALVEEVPTVLIASEQRRTVRRPTLRGWRPEETRLPDNPFWNIEDWHFSDASTAAPAPNP